MFSHGAVTSIVGPNGCGKSTMVKLVDGLLRPQAG
ncbi:MAG: ATP-binding cassette domain-containing protein, partial [Eggerthella sp.]